MGIFRCKILYIPTQMQMIKSEFLGPRTQVPTSLCLLSRAPLWLSIRALPDILKIQTNQALCVSQKRVLT